MNEFKYHYPVTQFYELFLTGIQAANESDYFPLFHPYPDGYGGKEEVKVVLGASYNEALKCGQIIKDYQFTLEGRQKALPTQLGTGVRAKDITITY